MKQMSDCGFQYFTNRYSYYSKPSGHDFISEFELLTKPELNHLSKADINLMRGWRIEHGQKMRQNTIRNTSTKDKPGTLPLNMYINYKQPDPCPVELAADTRVAIDVEYYAVKHGNTFAIIECKNDELQGQMFTEKENFTFVASDDITIEKTDIVCSIDDGSVSEHDESITISEELYETTLRKCSDSVSTQLDTDSDSDSDDVEIACAAPSPINVSRIGRRIKFNTRYTDFI